MSNGLHGARASISLAALVVVLMGCGGGGDDTATPETPTAEAPRPDADKDGVADADDAAPNDPLCSAASDFSQGACLVRTLAGMRLKVVGNAEGKLLFTAEGDALSLHVYDLATRHFTISASITGFTPTTYAYVPAHGRAYVGDNHGTIRAYGPGLPDAGSVFAQVPMAVDGLTNAGNHLLVQDESGAWSTHYLFDRTGKLTHSLDWNYNSRAYAWDAVRSRVYFFRDDTSPNDLHWEQIDTAAGTIVAAGETPYHGSYDIAPPIRVSLDGSKVLLGTGDLYAAPGLTWVGKVTEVVADAGWMPDGQLLVASGGSVHRYDTGLNPAEKRTLDGELLAIASQGSQTYLVVKTATHLDFTAFTPSDDTDGDGVPNAADRFPQDPAAAVDSDNDGHPDTWLAGRSAADSTTGLTLDAYPLDASCHDSAQGDGVRCDPALSMPAFVPSQVVTDGAGLVFLTSPGEPWLYRWSATTGTYLSPLPVALPTASGTESPAVLTHVPAHGRLYLGYPSGRIMYVDLATSGPLKRFGATAMPVMGLAAAGNYVVAQDSSGAWATHYVFDKAGNLTSSREWNAYSRHYGWAPNQSRLYYFRDDTSPNDLMWEEIDQTSGSIKAHGESPYHGDHLIRGPIRVSPGGARLVLGSGDVYSTTDLKVTGSLPVQPKDMQWFDDGSLMTISASGADTLWTRFDNALAAQAGAVIAGAPVAVVRVSGGFVVLTNSGGVTQMTRVAL